MELVLYLSLILLATLTEAGSTRDSFFQCQTSNETGQLYFPDIPDRYFDQEILAELTADDEHALKTTEQYVTHIFSIPAGVICNGSMVAIEYCHRTNTTKVEGMNEVRVFEVLELMELEEMQYLVTDSIQITSVLNESICSAPSQGDIQQVCCNRAELRENRAFQIPTSDITFGITSRAYQPLTIPEESSRSYLVEQIQTYLQISFPISEGENFTVTTANRKNDTFPLIRFIIDDGSMLSTTTEDDQTAPNSEDNGSLTRGEIAAAIIVPLLVITLATVVIILLVILWIRRTEPDDKDQSRVVHNKLSGKKITSTTELLSSPASADKTGTNRSTRMLLQQARSEEEEEEEGEEEGRVVENELYGEKIAMNEAYGSMEHVDNISDQEIDYESFKVDGKFMRDNLSDQEIDYESLKVDGAPMEKNEAYGTLEKNAELPDGQPQENFSQGSLRIIQNALYESTELVEQNEGSRAPTHSTSHQSLIKKPSPDHLMHENNPAPPTSTDNGEWPYATPPEEGNDSAEEKDDDYIYPHVYTNVDY